MVEEKRIPKRSLEEDIAQDDVGSVTERAGDGNSNDESGEETRLKKKPRGDEIIKNFTINPPVCPPLTEFTAKQLREFKRNYMAIPVTQREAMKISSYIDEDVKKVVNVCLRQESNYVKISDWEDISAEEFFKLTSRWHPNISHDGGKVQDPRQRLLDMTLKFDGSNFDNITRFANAFGKNFEEWKSDLPMALTGSERNKQSSKLIEAVIKKIISENDQNTVVHSIMSNLLIKGDYLNDEEFLGELTKEAREALNVIEKCRKYGMTTNETERKKNDYKNKLNERRRDFNAKPEGYEKKENNCYGCGRLGHHRSKCSLKTHPDFNSENVPWAKSAKGSAWSRMKDENGNFVKCLPFRKTLSGAPFNVPRELIDEIKKTSKGDFNKFKGESLLLIENDSLLKCISPFIYAKIYYKNINSSLISVLDTGALKANFVAKHVLIKLGIAIAYNTESFVSLADDSEISCYGEIVFDLIKLRKKFKIDNNCIVKEISIENVNCKVIDCCYDLIIGLPTIRNYRLITEVFKEMFEDDVRECENETVSLDCKSSTIISSQDEIGALNLGVDVSSTNLLSREESFHSHERLMLIKSKEEMLGISKVNESELPRGDLIDIVDMIEREKESDNEILSRISFENVDQEFNNKLKSLCLEFIEIFKVSLNKNPADVPAMKIEIKEKEWLVESNRQSARFQGLEKQEAIFEQIEEMKKAGIICESSASAWSQVHLVKKPNGEYRFCIDYRNLNQLTTNASSWPLPNIREMLYRLGNLKGKYFAKMDLTKGYFQAPLDKSCRKWTAFMVFCGLFEFTRVPMGAKGSPSYFQNVISNVVLAGLLYIICELYIDDIFVHAKTKDELLKRLRIVFERLKRRNVTLNPDKCSFGAEEVEFVGHVINGDGLKMSDKKKNKILNFNKPKNMKGLKSYLGLANYFRDHIKDHAKIVGPLQRMIGKYKKNKMIHWTVEADNAFEEVKKAISTCPMLYFYDDTLPIFVNTDASDYAIGGYLYQVENNNEKPIAFMSRTLNHSERKWSTYDKEACAIHEALKLWEPLLIGRRFVLKTDHKNLTFMKNSPSQRVNRWLLELQHLDFDCEHVQGIKNIVADYLSRNVNEDNYNDMNNNESDYNNNDDNEDDINSMNESNIDLSDVEENIENDRLMILKRDNKIHVIPTDIYRIIGRFHSSKVGHFGVKKTIEMIKSWSKHKINKLNDYVREFIRRCPVCQKMSQMKPVIEASHFTMASYEPMIKLSVDTVGPLPETEDGYNHILVIIDCFTRWVEAYPIKSTGAVEAAECLKDYIGRFGSPKELTSDNGSQFLNEIINELIKLCGIDYLLSIPYSKEENSIVERANKEVLRHLRNYVYDNKLKKEWKDVLPFVRRIINSSINSSTGYSPAHLLFAGGIDLDRNIIKEFNNDIKNKNKNDIETYMMKMKRIQKDVLTIAQRNQRKKDDEHMNKHTQIVTEFPNGSLVLLQYPNSRMGNKPPTKLHSPWQGPFKVVTSEGSRYTLHDLVTGKTRDVHVSMLKQFIENPEIDPLSVAIKDKDQYLVHAILKHRKNKNKKLIPYAMEFLVHWEGYSIDQSTWEPWSILKNNVELHSYLIKNDLKDWIPDCFLGDYND